MSLWSESLIIDGAKIDPNVIDAIPEGGAILTSTMEGAESLELTVSDADMSFLRSGALTRRGKPSTRQQDLKLAAWQRFAAMRLSLDGTWFRFAGVQLNYDAQPWSVTLTFESELATLMRQQDAPFKWSRGKGTRLGFIHNLAVRSQNRDLSDRGILTFTTFSPDPFAKEDVAKIKDADSKKGLSSSAHLTINGVAINAEQRRNLTISLTEGEKQNANERVFLSMLVAGIGESGFRVIPNAAGSDYGGVFQGKFKGTNPQFEIGDTKGMAHYFLVGGKGFQAGGAIKLAASDTDLTPGTIAYKVEGDRSNFSSDSAAEGFYQQHISEAQKILDAWGGASKTYTIAESYEFRAGQKDTSTGRRENYWDASGRLVDERRFRRFARRNSLFLGPDEWFFKNQPAFIIDGDENFATQGLLGFTGDADVGMPISELRLRMIAPRGTGGAGVVFQFDAPKMPIDGRWLIWENRLDLTQSVEIADLTLRRPAPAKKEPAPTTRTRSEDTPETGSARDRIVAAAKKAVEKVAHYRYAQIRPMPRGLFDFPKIALPTGGTTDGILDLDCSAFVTLVYKYAAVTDPNGSGYNGRGNTGTLVANGRRTSNPQPGDLVFFGSGPPFDHVGIYIGGGRMIEMGSKGPSNTPVRRAAFGGYWTYDLSDSGTAPTSGSAPASTPSGSGWHPDASRVLMQDAGSFAAGAGHKIVHHTTEGSSIAGAESAYRANGSSPHFTFDHDSNVLHQHISVLRAARSLVHPAGTLETNKAWAIQIEHVGFTANTGSWSATAYSRIAALCRWIEANANVPRSSSVSFSPGASRLTSSEFFAYEGHIGHMHVPGNTHVDPGAFQIGDVI